MLFPKRLSLKATCLLVASMTLAVPVMGLRMAKEANPEREPDRTPPPPTRNTSPPPSTPPSPAPQRPSAPRDQPPPRQQSPSPRQKPPSQPDHASRNTTPDHHRTDRRDSGYRHSPPPQYSFHSPGRYSYRPPSRRNHPTFFSLGVGIPDGHFSFTFGDYQYFGYHGAYYRRTPSGYIIVHPPVGAIIPHLPSDCVRISASGRVYYMYDDIYYFETSGGYRIVDPPEGIPRQRDLASREFHSFWLDGKEFLFRDGQFFIRIPGGLVWAEPPYGAVSSVLPDGSISVWYQDTEYYERDKSYFQGVPDGFMLVPAPWSAAPDIPANDTPSLP